MRPVTFLYMDDSPLLERVQGILRRCRIPGVGSNCATETAEWLARPGVDLVIREGADGGDAVQDLVHRKGIEMVSLDGNAGEGCLAPGDEERLEAILQDLPASAAQRRVGDHLDRMMGRSEPMIEVVEQLLRMAPSYAPILVTGESGTGKGLAALAIHDRSRNREAPFVALNCGAIPAHLVESQLFGHEKGSFTGAHKRHAGVFERAGKGTLFLDEITELPLAAQVKLLRVLESGEVTRVGGERAIPLHCRIVSATNVCPEAALRSKRLREDLFYRLSVLRLRLPPLRERRQDIPELADHFTTDLARDEGWTRALSPGALDRLTAHPWRGNVRELKNTLHSAVVLSRTPIIEDDDLPLETPQVPVHSEHLRVPVGSRVEDVERRLILRTLDHLHGNKARAADVLGISLKTLYNRLHAYGEMLPRSESAHETA